MTQPYDIGLFVPGVPTGGEIVLRLPVARAVDFADDFAGSYATARVAAAASAVFTVKVNGTSVGTVTFGAASTTGTFVTTGGALSLSAGAVLSVEAPAVADATLADIGFNFKGTR